jgi:UDP:flavonoid glycosyltransferase YjiC (YdhE family)
MSQMRIACFATSDANHFIGVLAVASGLIEIGACVRIWTDKRFREQIMAAGIEFGDLFESGTIDDADSLSIPRPARIVAFSVRHCEALARTVSDWRPDLVFVEGFALIGQLIAQRLSRPWILINSGHLPNGPALRKLMRGEFPERISDECLHAVERLKTEFGHEDASPYSYISLPSPWMNIHLEPPEWLISDFDGLPRQIECFGSHLSVLEKPTKTSPPNRSNCRIYAAFGTIVWRYWTEEALRVLEALADAVERLPSSSLTIGLGGAAIGYDNIRRLSRECVKILPYADQINELCSHDLFVTHNGLNSTHEAVMLQVPMMSCPFVGDEPDLARLCVDFGISHRIADRVIHANVALTAEYFLDKISTAIAERGVMIENLSRVHKWEIETISRRKLTLESILCRF